jgi:hypothetical protein
VARDRTALRTPILEICSKASAICIHKYTFLSIEVFEIDFDLPAWAFNTAVAQRQHPTEL